MNDMISDVARHRPVLVGAAPTGGSWRVVTWAAGEAALSGRALLILRSTPQPDCCDDLDDVAARLREKFPEVSMSVQRCSDPPDEALILRGSGAHLVVVGSPNPRHGLSRQISESSALKVAMWTPCPVALVPPPCPSEGLSEVGRDVVVGIDGSAAATIALHLAFTEAAQRDCALSVIGIKNSEAYGNVDLWENQILESELQAWRDLYPQVRVHHSISRGRPADVLLAAARHAELLVIGARPRPGFLGIRDTSSTLPLLMRSSCPIILARSRTAPLFRST